MIPIEKTMGLLLKFGKNKYMKELLDGKVFMHNLQYYINLERNDGDSIVGDKYEGKLPIKDVMLSIQDPNTHQEITSIFCKEGSFDFGMSKFPVFCMFMFDDRNRFKNDEIIPFEENGDTYINVRYGFTDAQKAEMETFGDSVVIIQNTMEFVRRVKEAAKRIGVDIGYGPVNYYGNNEYEHQSQVMNEHSAAPLWKRTRYKGQQEYRFYLNKDVDDNMVLEIGDLHDIAQMIPSKVFLDGEVWMKAKVEPITG